MLVGFGQSLHETEQGSVLRAKPGSAAEPLVEAVSAAKGCPRKLGFRFRKGLSEVAPES